MADQRLIDFVRESNEKFLASLTTEERLRGLSAQERLKALTTDDLVQSLTKEDRELLIRKLKESDLPE